MSGGPAKSGEIASEEERLHRLPKNTHFLCFEKVIRIENLCYACGMDFSNCSKIITVWIDGLILSDSWR
jgi:hypothetical protein